MREKAPVQPRRGRPPSSDPKTTTTRGGLLRKTVYFSAEEWKAIRRRAFDEDGGYTDVIRQAVRDALGVKADDADKKGRTSRP